MSNPAIFFIGTDSEVGHHAAPLVNRMDNVSVVTPEEALKAAQPADLAIFYSEHFDRFRHTCVELKKRGVATLYLIDGILEWRNAWENRQDEPACPWTMRPVLSHKVACIGQSQARILNGWGNGPKIEVVGIPRLDSLAKAEPNNPRDESQPFRLLVMTAKCPGFTQEQIDKTVQGLSDLKQEVEAWAIANNQTVDVTWRLTQGIEKRVGVENALNDFGGNDIAKAIASADAVITTPSTAMLEAMLMQRPVAILEYNNTPQYVPSGWQITARDQMSNVLSQLASPAERRIFLQQTILDDALAGDGHACDRLEKLATEMLQIAKQQTAANQPLSFPANMLNNTLEGQSEFSHANVFESREEFSVSDPVELQSQLAHSRREIEHLQGTITQLQSELDEAHAIFDQIHDHPIAGPIVRVRQRLVDWLQRFKNRSDSDSDNSGNVTDAAVKDPNLLVTPPTNTHP